MCGNESEVLSCDFFSDSRTSLPSFSVYHIQACCFDCQHYSLQASCFYFVVEDLAALSGCDLAWSGSEDVNGACDMIAKPPSSFLSFTYINLLLVPFCFFLFVVAFS